MKVKVQKNYAACFHQILFK